MGVAMCAGVGHRVVESVFVCLYSGVVTTPESGQVDPVSSGERLLRCVRVGWWCVKYVVVTKVVDGLDNHVCVYVFMVRACVSRKRRNRV